MTWGTPASKRASNECVVRDKGDDAPGPTVVMLKRRKASTDDRARKRANISGTSNGSASSWPVWSSTRTACTSRPRGVLSDLCAPPKPPDRTTGRSQGRVKQLEWDENIAGSLKTLRM